MDSLITKVLATIPCQETGSAGKRYNNKRISSETKMVNVVRPTAQFARGKSQQFQNP
jgi:hypothetical protein